MIVLSCASAVHGWCAFDTLCVFLSPLFCGLLLFEAAVCANKDVYILIIDLLKEGMTASTLGSANLGPLIFRYHSPYQSCPWVRLTHGLGWFGLGRDFSVFDGLGWVNYSKSTKNLKGLL